jgi:hypothetical protein
MNHADLLDAYFTADNMLFVGDGHGVGIGDRASHREVRRLKYTGPDRRIVPHPNGDRLLTDC